MEYSGSSGSDAGGSDSASIKERIKRVMGAESRNSNQAAAAAGRSAEQSRDEVGRAASSFRNDVTQRLGSFKKGGKVKRTGDYKLHANERVLNTRQAKQWEKKKRVKSRRG